MRKRVSPDAPADFSSGLIGCNKNTWSPFAAREAEKESTQLSEMAKERVVYSAGRYQKQYKTKQKKSF